jgi:thioredoxin reductase
MTVRLKDKYDVAIIGAGPAGMAAAAEAARFGMDVVLFDEQSEPGGQIYRSITTQKNADLELLGVEYWYGKALADALARSNVSYISNAVVWGVLANLEIGVSVKGRGGSVRATNILLATGAIERPFPIEGWTIPGVLTAGAGQILLKTSNVVPAGRLVLAGTGPLLWLLATQYLNAGVRIEAILDTTPGENWKFAAQHFASFALSPYFFKGIALLSRVLRKVKIVRNVECIRAEGDDKIRSVAYRTRGSEVFRIETDTLLLHQGIAPNINMSKAIGCDHVWDDAQLSFRPVTNSFGETSHKGIFAAGDGAGIVGARASEVQGRLAAVSIAHQQDRLDNVRFLEFSKSYRRELKRWSGGRRFLDDLYRPSEQFRIPEDNVTICRCEEVTAAQLRQAVALGCPGPNQAKTFIRCGMGPCQGRLCGLTVTEIIAKERNVSAQHVGYYRTRIPVKPITLEEIAAHPVTEESIKAVVRDLPPGLTGGEE